MPTDRRMGELRKEGQIFHSHEVAQVLSLLTGFLLLSWCCKDLFRAMKVVMIKSFELISRTEPFEVQELERGFIQLVLYIAPSIFIITILVATVYTLSVFLQTNWNIKPKWIKFNWQLIKPVQGLKRIFSMPGLITVLKSIVKLSLILPIGYFALKSLAPKMVMLINTSIPQIMSLTGEGLTKIFWRIMFVLMAMALFDYVWGKYRWLKTNKMTKDEVKDERKSIEGDETMRRKMIAKGMQRLASRLRTAVPKADVVITNPTHYAVALRYDRDKNAAPVVVAKGADFIAQRIREIAKEHNVPILERKALARALFASADIGKEIPKDLFRAVAEVLAYVYRLKNPFRKATAAKPS